MGDQEVLIRRQGRAGHRASQSHQFCSDRWQHLDISKLVTDDAKTGGGGGGCEKKRNGPCCGGAGESEPLADLDFTIVEVACGASMTGTLYVKERIKSRKYQGVGSEKKRWIADGSAQRDEVRG